MSSSLTTSEWPEPGSIQGGACLTPRELLGFPPLPKVPVYQRPIPAYLRNNPPQAVLDAIADCPHGVEVTGDYESVCIRPLLLWQAALDALVSRG